MSTSALPPLAPTTLVIMLGASAWPNSSGFQASQAFVYAAQGFKGYLLDPRGFGLPVVNLFDLFDAWASASDQLEMLGTFLEQRSQTLNAANQAARDVLVYFVGHGGFAGPSADFYLLPRRANASSLRASGIAIDALAEVLREKARLARRYLLLDCCFAAAAFRAFQGGPDQTAITKTLDAFAVHARSRGFPRRGTVLLCSSDQKSPSLLLPDESCTMFSYALLEVLKNGDLHRPLQLSLRDLKELAEDRLAALPEQNAPRPGLHSPDQSEGDVADVPLFPNPSIEREQARLAQKAEQERLVEEEKKRRLDEERRRQAEQAEQARLARQEQMRQIEEERRQAEIETQKLTPKETISPSLAEPGPAQSSNSAAAKTVFPVRSPPFLPGNQLRQESAPGEVVANRIPRRTVILGLGIAGLAVAGGGIALLVSSQGQHLPVVSGQTPASIPLENLLFTYKGHSDQVYAVAWSPDGKRIASASADHTVQVWDTTTGGHVFTYRGHSDQVDAVAWSPDGKRIASAGAEQTVQVCDAATGGHVFIYHGHSSYVSVVAWSPDGKRIASGSDDKTVQVWDDTTGGHVFTYRGHSDTVEKVAWSPDGKHIASGSNDKTVQVWDAVGGFHVYTYYGHSDIVDGVAWSLVGSRIVSGSDDKTVQVWDATTGGHVFTYRGHSGPVETVAWSLDGSRIVSGSADHTVQVWDATTGGHVFTYRGHSDTVWSVASSPDGKRIASASADHTVQVWEAE